MSDWTPIGLDELRRLPMHRIGEDLNIYKRVEAAVADRERLSVEVGELREEVRCWVLAATLTEQKTQAEIKGMSDAAGKHTALRAELGALRETVDTAWAILQDAPELNPSNYNHDDVCTLNAACCEAHGVLAATRRATGETAESEGEDES